jgi:16S rRNA (guanine1516-N2)-methyltransferase
MNYNIKIAVTTNCNMQLLAAKELAEQLNLSFIEKQAWIQRTVPQHDEINFILNLTPERLQLEELSQKNSTPIYVDFLDPELNFRTKHAGKNNEIILKAIGIKNNERPTILDTTAGLGTDAFLLASKGCEVLMLERSPIIGALLQDGLARYNKQKFGVIKLVLLLSSANNYLATLKSKQHDVIYLDPMYPPRVKSALGEKNMRVLHTIVGADADADEILTLALQHAKKRVVVKRPKLADNLGLLKPDIIFTSNASSRYDVYIIK